MPREREGPVIRRPAGVGSVGTEHLMPAANKGTKCPQRSGFSNYSMRRKRRRRHTWDQRASRAFAAEFLAPADALTRHVTGPVSFSDIDELGDEYGVSSLVIEHQIENHRLGSLTDA